MLVGRLKLTILDGSHFRIGGQPRRPSLTEWHPGYYTTPSVCGEKKHSVETAFNFGVRFDGFGSRA